MTGTNDTPTVEAVAVANTVEDTTVTGQIVADDVDNDSVLTYSATEVAGFSINAETGAYSFDASDATYQHIEEGVSETITSTVTVTDEHGATTQTEVTFNLTGTNDLPIVEDITAQSAIEDGTIITGTITSTDIDDNATATYSTTAEVAGFTLNSDGSYSLDASVAEYQALKQGEIQTITIPVIATDEKGGASESKDLVITVTGTNDTPAIVIIEANAVDEDSTITGEITSTDIDHDATATFSTTAEVAGFTLNSDGSYSLDASHEDYQHLAKGAIQTITIPVTVTDEHGAEDTKDLTITVTGTNDTPTVEAVAVANTVEDTTVTGQIVADDVDNDSVLTYSATEVAGFSINAETGAYSFDASDAAYQELKQGEVLTVDIPVTVTDEEGAETSTTVSYKVTGTNDTPTVEAVAVANTVEDTTVTGQIVADDVDNDSVLTYSATEVAGFSINAETGAYSFDASDATYQHIEEGVSETITSTVTVTDEHGATTQTEVTFNLTGTNDLPIVEDITAQSAIEDGTIITGTITSTDIDDNAIVSYSIETEVAGFILEANGAYSFDPSDLSYQSLGEGEELLVSIPVTATDEYGASSTKNLIFTVLGTNDLEGKVREDNGNEPTEILTTKGLIIVADGIDLEEYTLSVNSVSSQPIRRSRVVNSGNDNTLGTLSVELSTDGKGTIVWEYNVENSAIQSLREGESKEEIFEIILDNGEGGQIVEVIRVTIVGTNDIPIITGDLEGTVQEYKKVEISGSVQVNDQDTNESQVKTQENIQGEHGVFSINIAGIWSYELINDDEVHALNSGESLTETFYVESFDGTKIEPIVITILGNDNDAPVVLEDSVITEEDTSINISVLENDIDGDTLTLSKTTTPEHGSVVINDDNTITYRPNDNYNGTDSFEYTASDGDKESSETVDITVNPVNDTPVATDDNINISELLTSNIYNGLLANDMDIDGDNLKIVSVNLEQYSNQGNLQLNQDDNTGYLTFTPSVSFSEVKEFTYTISDGHGGFDTATVTVADNSLNILNGTNYDDCLIDGTSKNDIIYGHDGNDKISGNSGADIIYGGDGIDCISGGCGDDILIGGAQSDTMSGGCGDDTYMFNLGDGKDTICDGGEATEVDVITFGEGVNRDDISFFMKGSDLHIQYSDNDQVIAECHTEGLNIEKISLADGSYLTDTEISALIQTINAYALNDGINIDNMNDIRENDVLMGMVSTAWHS